MPIFARPPVNPFESHIIALKSFDNNANSNLYETGKAIKALEDAVEFLKVDKKNDGYYRGLVITIDDFLNSIKEKKVEESSFFGKIFGQSSEAKPKPLDALALNTLKSTVANVLNNLENESQLFAANMARTMSSDEYQLTIYADLDKKRRALLALVSQLVTSDLPSSSSSSSAEPGYDISEISVCIEQLLYDVTKLENKERKRETDDSDSLTFLLRATDSLAFLNDFINQRKQTDMNAQSNSLNQLRSALRLDHCLLYLLNYAQKLQNDLDDKNMRLSQNQVSLEISNRRQADVTMEKENLNREIADSLPADPLAEESTDSSQTAEDSSVLMSEQESIETQTRMQAAISRKARLDSISTRLKALKSDIADLTSANEELNKSLASNVSQAVKLTISRIEEKVQHSHLLSLISTNASDLAYAANLVQSQDEVNQELADLYYKYLLVQTANPSIEQQQQVLHLALALLYCNRSARADEVIRKILPHLVSDPITQDDAPYTQAQLAEIIKNVNYFEDYIAQLVILFSEYDSNHISEHSKMPEAIFAQLLNVAKVGLYYADTKTQRLNTAGQIHSDSSIAKSICILVTLLDKHAVSNLQKHMLVNLKNENAYITFVKRPIAVTLMGQYQNLVKMIATGARPVTTDEKVVVGSSTDQQPARSDEEIKQQQLEKIQRMQRASLRQSGYVSATRVAPSAPSIPSAPAPGSSKSSAHTLLQLEAKKGQKPVSMDLATDQGGIAHQAMAQLGQLRKVSVSPAQQSDTSVDNVLLSVSLSKAVVSSSSSTSQPSVSSSSNAVFGPRKVSTLPRSQSTARHESNLSPALISALLNAESDTISSMLLENPQRIALLESIGARRNVVLILLDSAESNVVIRPILEGLISYKTENDMMVDLLHKDNRQRTVLTHARVKANAEFKALIETAIEARQIAALPVNDAILTLSTLPVQSNEDVTSAPSIGTMIFSSSELPPSAAPAPDELVQSPSDVVDMSTALK